MKVSVCFSWPAWKWINTVGLLLWELLSHKWYYVLWDKEYASIIKWDNNIFVLYISDDRYFCSNQIDHFFAFDEFWLEKNKKVYNLKNIYKLHDDQSVTYVNTFFFWWSLKVLWIDLAEWISVLESKLKWEVLELNKKDLELGYYSIEDSTMDLSKSISSPKSFKFWNELVWQGSIESWLQFYSAYPMTPASSLIDVIIESPKVTFFQWEDEIAVAMSMLWAKFAWKRAMCGTSGGWFALMTESISFSNQAEIGGVYILSQRSGPSTGTPTFTEQADILYAVNSSFGDTQPIVVAPSTFEEGYTYIWKALNWSDIYQQPIIFLVDKQFSESYLSLDEKTLIPENINRWNIIESPQEWYARYQITDNGLSSYTFPWIKNWEFIASSYEHDIYWDTTEDPQVKKVMTEKRFKKIDTFIQNEFNDNFYGYEIINPEATKFIITFGFTRYNVENLIKEKQIWCIILKMIQPLDMRLKDFLESNFDKIEKLVFVENNYSGQLEKIVRDWLRLDSKRETKINHFRKYTLYPIFEEELWEII